MGVKKNNGDRFARLQGEARIWYNIRIAEDGFMSSRERENRIEYMVTCVGDFATQYAMTPASAYLFLEKYGGMAFLSDCYDVEHSQSIQTAVDDMAEVCRRNGAVLA